LSAKIAETRTKIQQIRDRVAPYDFVPQYIYWKNNGEEIQYYVANNTAATAVPWYRPTQVPTSSEWKKVDWAQHLTVTNSIDNLALWQGLARFFVPGKSELFPYDQATLDAYQGRLTQNPGY